MPAVRDFSSLLAPIPKGSWVAISHDEQRIVAFAASLEEAVRKAKEVGEPDPIVIRVPETDAGLLL